MADEIFEVFRQNFFPLISRIRFVVFPADNFKLVRFMEAPKKIRESEQNREEKSDCDSKEDYHDHHKYSDSPRLQVIRVKREEESERPVNHQPPDHKLEPLLFRFLLQLLDLVKVSRLLKVPEVVVLAVGVDQENVHQRGKVDQVARKSKQHLEDLRGLK